MELFSHSVSDPKFIDEHPIIYWNLIWAFERINVQTHLPNLYFKHRMNAQSDSLNKKREGVTTEEGGSSMKLVEEGTDPLTQELAVLGEFLLFFLSVY